MIDICSMDVRIPPSLMAAIGSLAQSRTRVGATASHSILPRGIGQEWTGQDLRL